jgi:hypothetical protein
MKEPTVRLEKNCCILSSILLIPTEDSLQTKLVDHTRCAKKIEKQKEIRAIMIQ